HLFWAFLQNAEGIIPAVLKKLGINPSAVQQDIDQELHKLPRISGGTVYLSDDLNRILIQAEKEAAHFKDEYISAEHILLAAVEPASKSSAGNFWARQGVNKSKCMQALASIRGNQRV